MESGIFLDVTQSVDAVAHHQAHGASVIIGPHALGAMALLGPEEVFSNQVERVVPGNLFEIALALRAPAPQWMQEPLSVMLTLGIPGDLRANNAGGVIVIL